MKATSRTLNLQMAGILLLALSGLACLRPTIGEGWFFRPQSSNELLPEGSRKEDVWYKGSDGTRLHALFLRVPRAKGTVLNFGGNEEYLALSGATFHALASQGLDVFWVEYRGYGQSEGKPAIATFTEDARAAFDALASQAGVDRKRILVRGMSLGSFAAVDVAASRPVAGLVLDSAGSNVDEFLSLQVPWYAKPFFHPRIAPALRALDNAKRITQVHVPTIILVGELDRQTPPLMAEGLLKASGSEKKRLEKIPGVGHGNLYETDAYGLTFKRFLDEALPD